MPPTELTRRERAVLVMLAEGMTQEEIARRSYVSASTIHKQCASIKEKLGVPTLPAAVLVAVRQGVLR